MQINKKGMLAPFTILTSIITGVGFPILGSMVAYDMGLIESIYAEGLILVIVGGFIAQWTFAHSIHDYIHLDIENRITLTKKSLKITIILSLLLLLIISLYLAYHRGWLVLLFSGVGLIVSLYAEGLLHFRFQMAIGATFLVLGSFYVQTTTLEIEFFHCLKLISISLFAFMSQFGWLLLYRLDDYKYNEKLKNVGILVTKTALIFLIIYLLF
jgi:hypothetical protein